MAELTAGERRIIRCRGLIQKLSETFDDMTSGQFHKAIEDPETAKALHNIVDYAKGLPFMELEE